MLATICRRVVDKVVRKNVALSISYTQVLGGASSSFCTQINSASKEAAPFLLSAVQHPYPINGIPIDTIPTKPTDLFAIVGFSGTQYKVTLDDVIITDRMEGIDIGQTIELSEVLLVGSRRATVIGRPTVEGCKVIAAVEEITKDKKVIAFKTRRRKHSRSLRGFRRDVTVLRIGDIILGDKLSKEDLTSLL